MKVKEILETMDYGKAPESPEQALAWIAKHEGKMSMYLNGEAYQPAGCEFFESRNPSNGEALAQIPQATQAVRTGPHATQTGFLPARRARRASRQAPNRPGQTGPQAGPSPGTLRQVL